MKAFSPACHATLLELTNTRSQHTRAPCSVLTNGGVQFTASAAAAAATDVHQLQTDRLYYDISACVVMGRLGSLCLIAVVQRSSEPHHFRKQAS